MSYKDECLFNAEHLVGGALQIYLVFVFLTLFFFLYVLRKEKEIFRAQIAYIVDSFTDTLLDVLDVMYPEGRPDVNKIARDALARFEVSSNEELNKSIKEANDAIRRQAGIILVVCGVVLMIALGVLWYSGACFSFGHRLGLALAMLIFIALTEYLFLNLVAKNHIAAEVNKIKASLLDTVSRYAREKIRTS